MKNFFKRKRPIFGAPIEDAVKMNAGRAPTIMRRCIDKIEQALHIEGVYRVPGSVKSIESLRKAYDAGDDPDLSGFDVFVVGGLLKTYFSSLPDPLMTFALYDSFISAQTLADKTERTNNIAYLIRSLPDLNRRLLFLIVRHLRVVSDNCATTKMTIPNLALVFGPTLLRPSQEKAAYLISHAPHLMGLLTIIVQEQDKIFQNEQYITYDSDLTSPQENVQYNEIVNNDPLNSGTENNFNQPRKISSGVTPQLQHIYAQQNGNTSPANTSDISINEDVHNVIQNMMGEVMNSDAEVKFSTDFGIMTSEEYDRRAREQQAPTTNPLFGPHSYAGSPFKFMPTSNYDDNKIDIVFQPSEIDFDVYQDNMQDIEYQHGSPKNVSVSAPTNTITNTNIHSSLAKLNQLDLNNITGKNFRLSLRDMEPMQETMSIMTSRSTATAKVEEPVNEEERLFQKKLNEEVGVDIQNPLESVKRRIQIRRKREGRDEDLAVLSPQQLKEEKSLIKKELRYFDKVYKQKTGRNPSKHDKEPLRELYQRYQKIKTMLEKIKQEAKAADANVERTKHHHHRTGSSDSGNNNSSKLKRAQSQPSMRAETGQNFKDSGSSNGNGNNTGVSSGSSKGSLYNDPTYVSLKAEKKDLQKKLHQFQNDFVAAHGRNVYYHSDKAPMEVAYERYKYLKSVLASMEQQYKAQAGVSIKLNYASSDDDDIVM